MRFWSALAGTTTRLNVTNQLRNERRSGANAYNTTFSYDAVGNRLVKIAEGARTTSVYDAANQLRRSQDISGITTFTFDQSGNQQLEREPGGNRTTYSWDYENQNTLVRLPGGSRVTMSFNADLRRVTKSSDAVTNYIWDVANDSYLLETDGNGDTVVEYTSEPARYGRVVSQRRGGQTSFYLFDAQGSTRVLTDGSQNTSDTYLYSAFGETVAQSGSTDNSFQYVGLLGYYLDPETGELYVRARVYQPGIGRWLSRDPLLALREAYFYVRNNPIKWWDPRGLYPCIHERRTFGKWTLVHVGASEFTKLTGSEANAQHVLVLSLSCLYARTVVTTYRCHPCCWAPMRPHPANTCKISCVQLGEAVIPGVTWRGEIDLWHLKPKEPGPPTGGLRASHQRESP
jgi:RHS repeat-associated protein